MVPQTSQALFEMTIDHRLPEHKFRVLLKLYQFTKLKTGNWSQITGPYLSFQLSLKLLKD